VQPKNVQNVPTINKDLVSGSILYMDDFKIVLDSNKIFVYKSG
jgi:hypothetical protein